jgi:conjugal transfer pilus assembly protein TraW
MINKIILTLVMALSVVAHAEDLGIKNQSFVNDRDAREEMKDVVRQKMATGEVDQFWKDYQSNVIGSIKSPAPLGIPSSLSFATTSYNPQFVLPSDYKDEKGNVVARKGTLIEPLKLMPLTVGLIFIDGRDQQQVDYAIAAGRKEPLKIVLVAGSAYELRIKYKNMDWNGTKVIPFYFDQKKMIITQLNRLYGVNINHVPAKMIQRGSQLVVEFGIKK